jgi:hypothetical protein
MTEELVPAQPCMLHADIYKEPNDCIDYGTDLVAVKRHILYSSSGAEPYTRKVPAKLRDAITLPRQAASLCV